MVDRPLNGTVEPDEISVNKFQRLGDGFNGPNSFELGGEITQDSEGRLGLHEQFANFGPYYLVGPCDIQWMQAYRQNDANWNVPKQA